MCVDNRLFFLGAHMGRYFAKFMPRSNTVKELVAICNFWTSANEESLRGFNELERGNSDESVMKRVQYNKKLVLRQLEMDMYNLPYIFPRMKPTPIPFITFSITTCRRLSLFKKTMNSILHNCLDLDLISHWILVDDQSSEEDRAEMKQLYPFFQFVFKNKEDKGHPKSMQLITSMVKTPYLVHWEDDRLMVDRREYLADMIHIMENDASIGQVVFNHNYAETLDDDIKGGILKKTGQDVFYYIHQYCPTDDLKEEFKREHGDCVNCNYYPHFTLSPSMIRMDIFKRLNFIDQPCFEFCFALRFAQAGYVSAFLPGFAIKHIGRLTRDRESLEPNAYDLISTDQFTERIKYKYHRLCHNTCLDEDFRRILFGYFENKDFSGPADIMTDIVSTIKLYLLLDRDDTVDGYIIETRPSGQSEKDRYERILSVIKQSKVPRLVLLSFSKGKHQVYTGANIAEMNQIDHLGDIYTYYISKEEARDVLARYRDETTIKCPRALLNEVGCYQSVHVCLV